MKVCAIPGARLALRLLIITLCATALSACGVSQLTSPFGSSSNKRESWNAQVSEARLLEAAKNDSGGSYEVASAAINCPPIKVTPGDRLLTIYEIGRVGDGLAIQHRGEITKTARECQIYPDRIDIKYGFAGRVLLGPKGRPGTFKLPLKVNITDRKQNIVSSQRSVITVTITAGNPIAYFSAVREVSIPLPPGVPPSDYQIFVAFEHTGPGAG